MKKAAALKAAAFKVTEGATLLKPLPCVDYHFLKMRCVSDSSELETRRR